MIEDVHCPAPQPEDHSRDGDPGFHEDPDIYIEFDDGVFYQASLDGLRVAITADYPRLYPFCIVSIRRALERKPLSALLLIIPFRTFNRIGVRQTVPPRGRPLRRAAVQNERGPGVLQKPHSLPRGMSA
jgi:hypothetical protein